MEAAWRNAECVTSLYERLQELELRNAQLEAEVLKWREESQAMHSGDVTASIDLARAIRERDEWQDLSKQQEEDIHRLEMKLKNAAMEHSEQIAKWKERCVFDPNQPKRVALCMASLQKTLDARIEENEAMSHRMQDMYAQNSVLFQENCALREQEFTRVEQLTKCRSYALFVLLQKKTMHQINWSWRRWFTHVLQHRFDEESKCRADALVNLSTQRIQLLQEHHLQNFQRRWCRRRKSNVLWALKNALATTKQSRQNADAKTRVHALALTRIYFHTWHQLSYRSNRLKLLLRLYCKRSIQFAFIRWERQMHRVIKEAQEQELFMHLQTLKATKKDLHETQLALKKCDEQVSILQAHLDRLLCDSEKANFQSNQELKKIFNHIAQQFIHRKHQDMKQTMLSLWRNHCHFKHKVATAYKFLCLKSLRRTVQHWHVQTRTRLCSKNQMRHMTRRRLLYWARITFDAWLIWVTKQLHRKQRVELLQSRRDIQVHLKPALRAWKIFKANQLKKTHLLEELIVQKAAEMQRQSLKIWANYTSIAINREQRLRQALISTFIRRDKVTMHNTFCVWVYKVKQIRTIRTWMINHEKRAASRQQQKTLREWMNFSRQCLNKRQALLKLITSFGFNKPKHRAFDHWKLFVMLHRINELHQLTLSDLKSQLTSLNASIFEEQRRLKEQIIRCSRFEAAQSDAKADAVLWQNISHKLERRLTKVESCLMSWEDYSLKQNGILVSIHDIKAMQIEDLGGQVASLQDQLLACKHQHSLLTSAQTKHAEKLQTMKSQLSSLLAKKALQIWLHQSQVYMFNQWKHYAKQRKLSRDKMAQIFALFQTKTLQRLFLGWKHIHILHKTRKLQCDQWHLKRNKKLLHCSFQAWKLSCRKAKYLKSFLRKFGMAFRQADLYEKFQMWMEFASARKLMRKCIARAIDHIYYQRIQLGWNIWRIAAAELSIQHSKASRNKAENALQQIWFRILQRNVLNFWKHNAAESRHERHLLMRCTARLRYFSVGKSFETWRYHSHLLKNHRLGASQLFVILHHRILKVHWKQWRQVHFVSIRDALTSSQAQAQQYQEDLHITRSVLERTTLQLQSTQEHTQLLKQQLRASICATTITSTLRSAFLAWQRFVKFKLAVKCKILKSRLRVARHIKKRIWGLWLLYMKRKFNKHSRIIATASHHKLAFIRLHFRHWIRYSKQNKAFRQTSQKVCLKLSRVVLRLVWNRWTVRNTSQRKACSQIVECTKLWELNALRRYWSRWHVELQTKKALVATDKAKMERVMLFFTDRKRNARLYYFTLWRRYVPIRQRKYQLDALATKFFLRQSWKKWICARERRHRWRALILSFTKRLLYSALTKWRSVAMTIHIENIENDYRSKISELQNKYAIEREDMEAHLIASHNEIMRLKQNHATENEIYANGMEELRSCAEKALFRLNKLLRRTSTLHKLKQVINAWVAASRLEKAEFSTKLLDYQRNAMAIAMEKVFIAWKSRTKRFRREQRLRHKFQLRYLKSAIDYWNKRAHCKTVLRNFWLLLNRCAKRVLSNALRRWALSALQMHLSTNYSRELDRERRLSMDASLVAVENTSKETQVWKKKLATKIIIFQFNRLALQLQAKGFQLWKYLWQFDLWKYQTRKVNQDLRQTLQSSFEGKLRKIAQVSQQESVLAREALIFPLESMFHVLFRAKTIDQLFQGVMTDLHTPGKLWLCDPKKEELWSMVDCAVHVAATHIGIAGHVFHSGAPYRSADVSQDRLFHPMVDKYVLEPLLAQSSKSSSCLQSLHMVCVAVKAKRGSTLGILQMACSSAELSIDMYILCHACATAVGCILDDVLQSSRDHSQAKVTKYFHQQKSWKHFYLEISNRLKSAQAEKAALESAKSHLEASHVALGTRYEQLRRELHLNEQTQHEFMEAKQAQLQDKILSLENKLIERENALGDLERIVAEKSHKLRKYKLALRTIHARSTERVQESESIQLAEITNLRNQLTRYQSDARFLSKAIAHVLDHGSLPKGMEAEVLRICQVV